MSIYDLHWIRNNPEKVQLLCSPVVDNLPEQWGDHQISQFYKVLLTMFLRHRVFKHHRDSDSTPEEMIDRIKIWEFIQVSISELRDYSGIGEMKINLVLTLRENWDVELGPWWDESVKKYFRERSTTLTSQEIDTLSVTDEVVPLARVREVHQELLASHSTVARMLNDLDLKSGEIEHERAMLLAKQQKIQTAMEALQKLSEDD